MKTLLITDTHFNHKAMVTYCGRPENFTEIILKNWEEMADENTVTYHLGDVIFSNASQVGDMLKRIKGKKILIKGNHDLNKDSWYLNKGFDGVCDAYKLIHEGKHILLTHIPSKDKEYHINIHGHFHNTDHRSLEPEILEYYDPTYHKLLAIENTDLKPVELEAFVRQQKEGGEG